MRMFIPYGKNRKVAIEIPDKNAYFVAGRLRASRLSDPETAVRHSIRRALNISPRLRAPASHNKIAILVDDLTRPTPAGAILSLLVDELEKRGVRDRQIQVIIALGTHRAMDEREIKQRFGERIVNRLSITNHDFVSEEGLVRMGKTKLGIPISINRDVYPLNRHF